MNIKLKAALYTIIPYLGTAIWLFSLATWYEPTLLFTLFFLWFVALPFAIYNLVYLNLKGKQNRADDQQRMKDFIAENKKASDRVQQTVNAMLDRHRDRSRRS